jgi:glycosyltransferase involved in cell wall biosynthesis
MSINNHTLAVVIPAYRASAAIESVIAKIPEYADWIIVVNDASPDDLETVVRRIFDPRIILICHEKNLGVGGAMTTGFRKALDVGADMVVKIDADGQMDPQYIDRFARLALIHHCDYVKANRFGHISELSSMPKVRLIGNIAMTFLTKIASGYWNVFDPQNGYVLITRRALQWLDLGKIDPTYFFENSMLINLNIFRAKIGEIYIPARYGEEVSSMKISKIFISFPIKLFSGFLYRMFEKYIFRSVSPVALLLVFGLLSIFWGSVWGGFAWYRSYTTGVAATTGTVILSLLPLLLGWSAVLQAFVLDVLDAGPCILFDYTDESLMDHDQ